ncbi:hypothetical protein HPB50_017172 [Hyalomma asiaticum]|uniref:Uncharacterized protein n=1 Tax=Hyalomma asiaticum TaxID=266040 RepID=A0ACB7TJA0_HYAAI|nr:hypothetical protein HPB50_017172 [Hyalomma asiaticum]
MKAWPTLGLALHRRPARTRKLPRAKGLLCLNGASPGERTAPGGASPQDSARPDLFLLTAAHQDARPSSGREASSGEECAGTCFFHRRKTPNKRKYWTQPDEVTYPGLVPATTGAAAQSRFLWDEQHQAQGFLHAPYVTAEAARPALVRVDRRARRGSAASFISDLQISFLTSRQRWEAPISRATAQSSNSEKCGEIRASLRGANVAPRIQAGKVAALLCLTRKETRDPLSGRGKRQREEVVAEVALAAASKKRRRSRDKASASRGHVVCSYSSFSTSVLCFLLRDRARARARAAVPLHRAAQPVPPVAAGAPTSRSGGEAPVGGPPMARPSLPRVVHLWRGGRDCSARAAPRGEEPAQSF